MTGRARGAFDVKLAPQPMGDGPEAPALGRMSIDKQYHGELEATGKGRSEERRVGKECRL